MEENKIYDRLKYLQETYPELTFYNIGYQYLPSETRIKYKEEIDEINNLLERVNYKNVKFHNFKTLSDIVMVRFDASYDERFTGVYYVNLEDFKVTEEQFIANEFVLNLTNKQRKELENALQDRLGVTYYSLSENKLNQSLYDIANE
jgi:hypothetical protein